MRRACRPAQHHHRQREPCHHGRAVQHALDDIGRKVVSPISAMPASSVAPFAAAIGRRAPQFEGRP